MSGIIKNNTPSILINSCDKYSDVWPVFFKLFFKYWQDCPFPIYLGSNEKVYNDPRVTTICVGPDKSWADSAIIMVSKIPTKDILWFLDDYFLWEPVSTIKVNKLYEKFIKLHANYMRLRPKGGSANLKRIYDDDIYELLPGIEYRTSLDNAFWDRDMLLKLLKPGESPWEMEYNGSRRSDKYFGYYATRDKIFKRTNGLERGKWLRYNLSLLKKENIVIPAGHPVMSKREHLIRFIIRNVWIVLMPIRSLYRLLKIKSL